MTLRIIFRVIALIASASLANHSPLLASPTKAKVAFNLQPQPQFQFYLEAEKKVVQLQQGKQKVTWQNLQGTVVAQQGDVIRYIVSGKNSSDRPVKDLVVTQPLPKQTIYVLNSITVKNNGAKITYSIDNGKSFTEKPTVQVKLPGSKIATQPAPAELYTHLRWHLSKLIGPAVVSATYQVRVR